MDAVIHNPGKGIYPATPDYVHLVEVRKPNRLVYVSAAILASAAMTVSNIIRVTSYLRDSAYADQNQDARVAALKGRAVPTRTIVVQTLSPDWLVEIEIIAAD